MLELTRGGFKNVPFTICVSTCQHKIYTGKYIHATHVCLTVIQPCDSKQSKGRHLFIKKYEFFSTLLINPSQQHYDIFIVKHFNAAFKKFFSLDVLVTISLLNHTLAASRSFPCRYSFYIEQVTLQSIHKHTYIHIRKYIHTSYYYNALQCT